MRGKCLGGSEPDGAGRVLEAHCPDENTGAQGHTVWVGGGLSESLAWCSADPPLTYTPRHLNQGGRRSGAGDRQQRGPAP